ncbi:hypothetical protein MYRNA_231 [Mycobacterium phage Myrna]|uniref:Uncharacterized protein n=1 Tax=Mycobacterium phage Myrna TaxID=546805 RepID=B5LJK1_9CAUD|nr:gp231 [Mycobacterium phage Myrna]ACH62198.1 hypothetical protein MYRNA_231 [Mycobacterium phage Myrna]
MTAHNFYNLDLADYPKDFSIGDRVRVHIGSTRGSSESWTTILAAHGPDTFVVDGEILRWVNENLNGSACIAKRELMAKGWLFEVDGKLHLVAHIDDLKSEAMGRMESHLYHMEEAAAGLL